jgi:hypothetical protein
LSTHDCNCQNWYCSITYPVRIMAFGFESEFFFFEQ